MGHGKTWTSSDDTILRDLWETEVPAWKVASELDRSVIAVYSRAKMLGLGHKVLPPIQRRHSFSAANDVRVQHIAPRANRDEDYVAACLAQGGFVARVQRGSMICDVYPNGRSVTLWQVGKFA